MLHMISQPWRRKVMVLWMSCLEDGPMPQATELGDLLISWWHHVAVEKW